MISSEKIFSVKNKVIIITGGAGFLGTEYARILLQGGAKVALFDICGKEAFLAKARALNKITGRIPLVFAVDITDPRQVRDAVKKILRRFGRVDVLINNAALNPASPRSRTQFIASPYEHYSIDLWRQELEVGLTGAFIVTQAVIPAMKKQRQGVIINIGSIYGETAPDNRLYPKGSFKSIGYATTKGALANFTRTLASYLGPFGIRVNLVTLGGIFNGHDKAFVKKYSGRTMLGRMALKDDFSGAILFLASDASMYMTGANLVIDGGWSAW